MFNAVVLPNAQQAILASALALGALMALRYKVSLSPLVAVMFASSWFVTVLYMIVGTINGAPIIALIQTTTIYIISPLLWVLVIDRAWRLLGVDAIVKGFAVLAVFASGSVGIYMFLYLNFGPQAVSFFGARSNLHLEEGYSGVTMHVSGSLIYLGAAFAASPGVLNSKKMGYLIVLMIALASIASGRTLAIIGLLIGASYYFFSDLRKIPQRSIILVFAFLVIGFSITYAMEALLGVDLFHLLERHLNKVAGGDVERPAQIAALMLGAENNWFLGSGHGVGVDYVRSDEFPWRYESVLVALLFKLGVIGLFLVLMPIIYSLFSLFRKQILGVLNKYDMFFGASLLAVTLAATTNPYPEAFAFQWMYLVPIYYFVSKGKIGRNRKI